ncbi:AGL124Cp [Eremothecium gossypii ATCC 10895]|uniref:AGL124Cp n=1 Tax=Eremothecium gossypii (strain ATCC 10895 / CBS 109.51 / FGSC 9923 / NRRL Y-1056) TaxID=284811 RepID=Q750R6_EREGS|nr:AGL124Cp [Eremothecium gossypii ATCC 10895]AAS54367.2 AGL124Cp [Eremothecium gossypii ATCC 10895]AEY98694.1 FAGL124Cp [Eremothecium gossypii FDAG1]
MGKEAPIRQDASKVKVKAMGSLFLLSYMDPLAFVDRRLDVFNIYLYIDIPTIDYYNDEMTQAKLFRLNRRFKIHKVKDQILGSFTDGKPDVWKRLLLEREKNEGSFKLYVCSSGSLRYVESIRFLIESCWNEVRAHTDCIRIRFYVQVTPTSQKWFTTFLNKEILDADILEFLLIDTYSSILSKSSIPFKEYYAKLNEKFLRPPDPFTLDSIVIVTNSTGVKALLTILSDRPLTSYLSQESLDSLNKTALQRNGKIVSAAEKHPEQDETPLKRNSSSIIKFQNSLLTSNKDKAVRVRSLSLQRQSHRPQLIPMSCQSAAHVHAHSMSSGKTELKHELTEIAPADWKHTAADERELEDDDDFDDDSDMEYESSDDDGISFYVPNLLSRTATNEPDTGHDTTCESSDPPSRRRFRSLSLMDPPSRAPFSQCMPPPLEHIEDEMCSPTVNNEWYTNIYVHDGHFGEHSATNQAKRPKRSLRQECSANGLIPPEFYSRLSSPSSSNNSSNSSLQNLHLLPGTFAKLLSIHSNSSSEDKKASPSSSTLFDKRLVSKSFDEVRRQPSIQLFQTLMNGNGLALNFRANKPLPSPSYEGECPTPRETEDSDANKTLQQSQPGSVATIFNSDKVSQTLNKFNLQIYNSDNGTSLSQLAVPDPVGSTSHFASPSKPSQPFRKPKFTLDLYGDDDIANKGAWVLGANNR